MDWNSLLIYKGMTLELVVWSMFAGITIAVLVILYNKNVLGPFVRFLTEKGAVGPENAVSLKEAGASKNAFVRFALSRRSTYSKIIGATAIPTSSLELPPPPITDGKAPSHAAPEADTPVKRGRKHSRPKLDELKFFIPPEMASRADAIYMNGGANILIALGTIALFLLVALLSFKVVPGLKQMLTNLIDYIEAANR